MKRLNRDIASDSEISQRGAVIHEISRLCQDSLALNLVVSDDLTGFNTTTVADKTEGILSANAKMIDDDVLLIRFELVRAKRIARLDAGTYFEHLSVLGPRVTLVAPKKQSSGETSLWVELKVKAAPMTPMRENAFLDELTSLQALAKRLQSDLGQVDSDKTLVKQYDEFKDKLEPVLPLRADMLKTDARLEHWANQVGAFLDGGNSVAIVSPHPVELEYALAVLAAVKMQTGSSIGRCVMPAIDAKGIVQLARTSPGSMAVPAVGVRMSTSLFDLSNEIDNLLASLAAYGKALIFTGTQQQLQSVFSGGQGGAGDPLSPVVCHLPDISFVRLARFIVLEAGRLVGGVPAARETELTEQVVELLAESDGNDRNRLVQTVARKLVNDWAAGIGGAAAIDAKYVATLRNCSETFAGLSPTPRVRRSAAVQARFTRVLADPELVQYFKAHLLCQDAAIEEQCEKLASEALTRPAHQLIRSCSVGTPATGKSEFCVLLSKKLGIPYVNIDAASMPDHHMAVTQLLGSGRGFVGSYQAGRLEQIAKHHTGAVVEVSDLDHAAADVRATLPEIFLQALETGEAQAANGAMFSCANIIFIFTMNLLAGMDEAVQKTIGFQPDPARPQVIKDAIVEMKQMLSSAFLSRIGTPVFYESLSGDALSAILERAMEGALKTAVKRMALDITSVRLTAGIGQTVLQSLQSNLFSFGARALLEHGRRLAARALNHWAQNALNISVPELVLDVASDGQLVIHSVEKQ